MTFLKLKNRILEAIRAFERFAESDMFIIFVGWIVTLISFLSADLVGFLIVTIMFCLIMMSNCKLHAIYPVMFTLAFVMSNKYSPIYNPSHYVNTFMLTMMSIMLFLIFFCAVFGLIKRGLSLKLSVGFYGMVAFCLSYILGGLLYSDKIGANFVAGSVISFMFIAPFCFFASFYQKEHFVHIVKSIVMATLVPVVQLAHRYIVEPRIVETFNKGLIVLGWGVSNAIGIVIAVGIPFSGYFLLKGKKPSLALIAMSVQLVGVVFTLSRASILVAVPLFFGICFYSLFVRRGKDLRNIILTALIILAVVGIVGVWQWDTIKIGYEWFLRVGTDDRGRNELVVYGLDRFRQEILFGVGVSDSIMTGMVGGTYIFFYHNIFIQVLAWGGIVGISFYIIHLLMFIYKIICTKNTTAKWIVILGFIAILVDSLLDCVIYYPYLSFLYALFIVMADHWRDNGLFASFKRVVKRKKNK